MALCDDQAGFAANLQCDAVGVTELQDPAGTDVLDLLVRHVELVEHCDGALDRPLVRDGEAHVVEPGAVLVELLLADRSQPEQRVAEPIDQPAVRERQLLSGLVVGVGWELEADGQAQDRVIEGAGASDVGDGESHVSEGRRLDWDTPTVAWRGNRRPRETVRGTHLFLHFGYEQDG